MRKAEVVKSREVEVRPLDLKVFAVEYTEEETARSISKKEIRELADALGLTYDDAQTTFAKKIMNAYMKKEKR